ncbi:DUF6660 family protein [Flavobacterium sp. U410]
MKFFVYIFSIYILALSIVPCSDAYNDCKSNIAIKELPQSHDHKSDHNDVCSPFCTCTCCSVSANPKYATFTIKAVKLIIISKIAFPQRDFLFTSNFHGSIWQPPKINA